MVRSATSVAKSVASKIAGRMEDEGFPPLTEPCVCAAWWLIMGKNTSPPPILPSFHPSKFLTAAGGGGGTSVSMAGDSAARPRYQVPLLVVLL